jgi:uncharacterized protein (DUF1499 family)
MSILKWSFYIVLALIALAVLAGQFGLFGGRPPQRLGVHDGRLQPPSRTENSVSSQADLWPDAPMRDAARIAPLPLNGDAEATMARLKTLVEKLPGARIIDSRADYLYVQFTTKLMKFVDDAEFWIDRSAGVIQVRSASRVGRKDFGVNRARIEALRRALTRTP